VSYVLHHLRSVWTFLAAGTDPRVLAGLGWGWRNVSSQQSRLLEECAGPPQNMTQPRIPQPSGAILALSWKTER
jgi:hypothetical protein